MFEVEMRVYNNTLTDTFENVEATLSIPDGMSFAVMNHGQQSVTQKLGTIAENSEGVCKWYLKGDKAGYYSLSAELKGVLMPYSEEFCHTYEAESPIKVYDENALRIYATAP